MGTVPHDECRSRCAGLTVSRTTIQLAPSDRIVETVRKNGCLKKFEELRVLAALFEHEACIRSPDVSIARTKINEVASA